MNTSALKSFAPAVRSQLMEAVGRKLDYVLTADTPDLRQAAAQVASLRREAGKNRAALIERVAYTWFNRLAALRFLDAQGWHPFKARVLTPATPEQTQPEILKLLRTGSLPAELHPHTDLQRLNDLLDGRLPTAIAWADPQGEAYRGLILAACRFYHTLLPDVFDKLNDESELLLPDDLLTATSVAEGFRTEITDSDCLETDASGKSRANVEILGWLYQFYISEKKDAVMARKSAVPTEDIPAVTQLFTPHWIVRYLVENSLGRLWLLNRPGSRLREHMPYYIEGEKNAPGGSPDDFLKITKPEEIRLCDPAVGSGHMLTYAFDLLTLIYEEEGYAPTEIPALILRHNLHGLEICPRAAQLAELALVFKAREKSRRFFQPEHLVRPHIIELRDVRFAENELRDYIRALGLGDLFNQPMLRLLHQFEEAKNFGSLIQPCLDERAIANARRAIEAKDLGGQLFLRETHLKVLRVLEQAEALTQRYHVVVANPPYMGMKQMAPQLKVFGQDWYPDTKADTFAMFIEQALLLVQKRGFAALVTMQSWMFLSSFESFRKKIIANHRVSTMAHLGPHAFDSIAGEIVQVSAFVLQSGVLGAAPGLFLRLIAGANEAEKERLLLRAIRSSSDPRRFTAIRAEDFKKIPGSPIAYWISDEVRTVFTNCNRLDSTADTREGMVTGNNSTYVRYWYETEFLKIYAKDHHSRDRRDYRWFPYIKGGAYRKWYGNKEYVVDWELDGQRIRETVDPVVGKVRGSKFNIDYIFRPFLSWNAIASGRFSARISSGGELFDSTGPACFPSPQAILFFAGFLNSCVANYALSILNPTVRFLPGDIGSLPFPPSRELPHEVVSARAEQAISISKCDWDNFETSWNFRDQPLLRPGLKGATLEASWRNWEAQSTAAIRRMQELETENNRLFIAAYGLDGELQPEVPEAQITLARAEARRDMAAFLSYAVGCMMGRYSPDHPGLILANAGDTLENFRSKIKECGLKMEDLSFTPDDDAIIPVLDGEWFEDDIVARTRDFLRATFGETTLKQNLRFIEDSLGKSLDKYFLTDFYKDHLQTYKKRPIYWLFQSPKKGFSALVYVHRYTKDTVNTLLNKYLRDYLKKLESRIAHLVQVEATSTVTKEKNAARKEADKLKKALKDCQDWERNVILPLAQQRLEIDLDDGVKVNYLKFVGAVQAIPGLAAKED